MKYILSTLFMFFVLNMSGQNFGYAINIAHKDETESKFFYQELLKKLELKGHSDFVIYDWEAPLLNLNTQVTKYSEKPAEYAVFVKQTITHSDKYRPYIKTQIDTSGRVNKAWFAMHYNASYTLKLVSIKTGVIDDVKKVVLGVKSKKTNNVIPKGALMIDHKKYFGSRTLKAIHKNGDSYSRIENLIYQKYKDRLVVKFGENRSQTLKDIPNVVYALNDFVDMNIYKVEIKDRDADKINQVIVNGGTKDLFSKFTYLDVYTVVEEGGHQYAKKVTFITADEIGESESIFKRSVFQSKKRFTRKIKKYDTLFAIRKPSLAKKIVKIDEENLVNISLNLKGRKNAFELEKRILYLPSIRLIERSKEKELTWLRNLYKDDRFMDYKMGALQDQQIGAQFLLTYENDNISVTDVASGKMVAVDQKEGRRNWLYSGYTDIQAMNLALLTVSKKSIELVKVLKEKKEKTKKIQLFHPFGFDAGDKIDISIFKEETVGGKTYKRKEFIAKGVVTHDKESPNIGIMYIKKKGRKALYQAIKNNEKLDFVYSIKRK